MSPAAEGDRLRWRDSGPELLFWVTVAALAALKIWLTSILPLCARNDLPHDDKLFLRLAEFLVRGEWFGPYDELTLAKRPLYPLFIAAVHRLGIPLFDAEHLLSAGAAALGAQAVAPYLRSALARGVAYGFILFHPATLASKLQIVLSRQALSPALALVTVAGAVGWILRRERGWPAQAPWALALAAGVSGSFLLREEGVWAVAVAAVALGAVLAPRGVGVLTHRRTRALLALAVALPAALPIAFVAMRNQRFYGVGTLAEIRSSAFERAASALARVPTADERLAYVPLPAASRRRAAAAVPSMRELEPYFAGELGRVWVSVTETHNRGRIPPGEIGPGFFWALREAAARAGLAATARDAATFYARLATEVEGACREGRLVCGSRGSYLLRDLRARPAARAAALAARELLLLRQLEVTVELSSGTDAEMPRWAAISRESVAPPRSAVDSVGSLPLVRTVRFRVLRQIVAGYRAAAPFIAVLALLALAAAPLLARRPQARPLALAVLVVAVGVGGLVAVLAVIHSTLFPTLHPIYLSTAYPLATYLAVLGACVICDARRMHGARPAASGP